MARLDQLAEGIASVLVGSSQPDPLHLSFNGHSPAEMAFLVTSVFAACERLGRPLAHVRVPHFVVAIIKGDPSNVGLSVDIFENENSDLAEVEFGRF
jgi:hypothetical protein